MLSEEEWRRVFEIQCREKRGEIILRIEQRLCERAMHEDPSRYQHEIFAARSCR